ncbi:hypothetical protein KM043_000136 [Ampulex compressa]|nr:hypothetical protein KM043_000136 [Ampulex compressa]
MAVITKPGVPSPAGRTASDIPPSEPVTALPQKQPLRWKLQRIYIPEPDYLAYKRLSRTDPRQRIWRLLQCFGPQSMEPITSRQRPTSTLGTRVPPPPEV